MCTLYRLTVHVVRKLFEEYDTSAAQRMLFLTTRESNRSIGLSYAMLSILCAARGESFARLAVGQTKLRHSPAPIFDFHSSMQTARRNRQTPKEFSPILHITLHCTVLRCTAPHRSVRLGPPCAWVGGCGAH